MANVPFELKGKSVYVAGHRGMVGSALMRRLAREDVQLVTVDRREVDLCNQAAVFDWFAKTRPQVIFLAAAKVGGRTKRSAWKSWSSMSSPISCRITVWPDALIDRCTSHPAARSTPSSRTP